MNLGFYSIMVLNNGTVVQTNGIFFLGVVVFFQGRVGGDMSTEFTPVGPVDLTGVSAGLKR